MSLDEFFARQHQLGPDGRSHYGLAVKKFNGVGKVVFEKVFLDEPEVTRVLNLMKADLEPSSWNLYVRSLKRYARWLSDPEDEVVPKPWKKIKEQHIDWEEKLKDKWLSEEEFYQLLEVVDHPRNKAMYAVAVEGALRPGELLDLKVRHCEHMSYGFDVAISGKTGPSTFPVVVFAPLLDVWLNHHPSRSNPESPLWVRRRGGVYGSQLEGIEYGFAERQFKRYGVQSGLNRNISLHVLRHTKITWTAKNRQVRVSDEVAKKMFRWSKNSQMFARYTHVTGVDGKEAFLALAGVESVTKLIEKPSVLKPKKCFRCGATNPFDAVFCVKCSTPLSQEGAEKVLRKEKVLELLSDPEVDRKFTLFLEGLKRGKTESKE